MISLRQRLALLTVILAGLLLTAVYAFTACPPRGGPATPPPLAPPAPACTDIGAPCPPWAR